MSLKTFFAACFFLLSLACIMEQRRMCDVVSIHRLHYTPKASPTFFVFFSMFFNDKLFSCFRWRAKTTMSEVKRRGAITNNDENFIVVISLSLPSSISDDVVDSKLHTANDRASKIESTDSHSLAMKKKI